MKKAIIVLGVGMVMAGSGCSSPLGAMRARSYRGGMPGDDDATVWQCRTEEGKIFNFVVKNDSTVIFVNNI